MKIFAFSQLSIACFYNIFIVRVESFQVISVTTYSCLIFLQMQFDSKPMIEN